MKDFFFGDINGQGGNVTIGLQELINIKNKTISKHHYTKQLNRFLHANNNQLVVQDGTSRPDFRSFLDRLDIDEIVCIEVEARTDINDSVTATLACNIYLDNGVISVRPHWCGYKKIRSDEVMSTLILPLYLNALEKKVTLMDDDQNTLTSLTPEQVIKKIFTLSRYPSQEEFNDYVLHLNSAIQVVKDGITGSLGSVELDKRRRNKLNEQMV